jgi:zinc/manganese transport system permease protein
MVVVLSVTFATTASVGGIFVALGTDIPISPYVTTISFLIYLVCRGVGRVRGRGGTARVPVEPRGERAKPVAGIEPQVGSA